jgi:hypothetical protein
VSNALPRITGIGTSPLTAALDGPKNFPLSYNPFSLPESSPESKATIGLGVEFILIAAVVQDCLTQSPT